MPRKCCVPNCTGNYDTSDNVVSVFRFPKEESEREMWKRKIPRENLAVTNQTVVCAAHFRDQDVIRVDTVKRPDGTVLSCERKLPKLAPGAYPCIFPKCPKYLSDSHPAKKRKEPDERRAEVDMRDEMCLTRFLDADKISNYEEFLSMATVKVRSHSWKTLNEPSFFIFYKIDASDYPYIPVSIKISSGLQVSVYLHSVKVSTKNLKWILGNDCVLSRWSQLENLLSHYGTSADSEDPSATFFLDKAVDCLHNYLSHASVNKNEELEGKILFFINQLELVTAKKHKYTPQTLAWCFSVYIRSSLLYSELYKNSYLTLPHSRNLRKYSSVLNVNEGITSEHLNYFKVKASKMESSEKIVNLLLDEIAVKPVVIYKGGKIRGFSQNKQLEEANSVQAFMISSLLSRNSEIVALVPVKNMTCTDLEGMTRKMLSLLREAGFVVLSVITDNNRINRNMMVNLCGGNLKCSIGGFCVDDNPLFLMFDTVHILKSVRNNWLNQQSLGRVLTYPDFDDHGKLRYASLDSLKLLYEEEKNQS